MNNYDKILNYAKENNENLEKIINNNLKASEDKPIEKKRIDLDDDEFYDDFFD